MDSSLWLIDLATGAGRDLTPDLDLWPVAPRWTPDGRHVLFTADRQGHHALLQVAVATGQVEVLAAEGAWTDVALSVDGSRLFALRSSYAAPPEVVELPLPGGSPRRCPRPCRLWTSCVCRDRRSASRPRYDGTRIGGWLIAPRGASAESPAPPVLWIHGGPLSSWNAWHWRWNPHLLVDRGYAVVLPDPGLSTGLRRRFVRRGWGRWGEEPYTDLMAVMDDASRGRTSMRRAPRPWAAPSAATWPTGSRVTRTGSGPSSPMPPCGTCVGFHGTTDWGSTMGARVRRSVP